MQIVSVTEIRDEGKRDKITSAIADKNCRAILNITLDQSKSALAICQETKIPISTVYRKLQYPCLKMLKVSGRINKNGKKYFFYQSKIRNVSAFFEDGNMIVKVTINNFHT